MNPFYTDEMEEEKWARVEDVKAPTCRECWNEVPEDGDLCPVCAEEERQRLAIEAVYKNEQLG